MTPTCWETTSSRPSSATCTATRSNSATTRAKSKWERVGQIPNQSIRDALLTLIVYQGDTEFASVEQQKNLLDNAPTEYDRQALIRVNSDEMRHGWQMCYLLVKYFGDTGKLEARKLLERRASEQQRLLGSFNQPVNNWLDFFTYTQFVDRDGKFQLTMLSHSAFAPLARSVSAMLKEEFFHMFTGNTGLTRIVRANRIPIPIIQKYFNKWLSTAYDLFGTDHSSSAQWAYVWGIKGRFDEATAGDPRTRKSSTSSPGRTISTNAGAWWTISTTSSPKASPGSAFPTSSSTAPSATTRACATASTVICSPRRNMRNICPKCFPAPRTSASSTKSSRARTGFFR